MNKRVCLEGQFNCHFDCAQSDIPRILFRQTHDKKQRKMKKIISLILLSLMFNTSCNSAKVNSEEPYIQLTKKRCFGKCPVYDLVIYKNGAALYNGIANVAKKGKIEFQIDAEELTSLKGLFKEAGFTSLKNKPNKRVRDLPITELKFGNKIVSFQGQDIPKEIKEIIKELELIVFG